MIASGCILLILFFVLFCINFISYYSTYNESYALLTYLAEHNGTLPDENPTDVDFFVSREFQYETRYFSAICDIDGNYIVSNAEHIAAKTGESAEEMCAEVFSRKKLHGELKISDSTFLYTVKIIKGKELKDTLFKSSIFPGFLDEHADYQLVLFLDCSNRFARISSVRTWSLLIGMFCFLVFVLLVSIFSRHAIQPIVENQRKQKEFITNAGHELKTPLAIINANTEVVEAINGENEWTKSTKNQVTRLTGLVNDLIAIARVDEAIEQHNVTLTPVNFSEIVQSLSEDFSRLAVRNEKGFLYDIENDVFIDGNSKMARELVSILYDNAVKYCDDGGIIQSELKQLKKNVVFTISNTYEKDVDCKIFFERFYREDTSHSSEKPGYGIGLSVAEMIVKLHNGRINVHQKDKRIYFTVWLQKPKSMN